MTKQDLSLEYNDYFLLANLVISSLHDHFKGEKHTRSSP